MLYMNVVGNLLETLATVFIFAVGLGFLVVIVLFVIDRLQTEDAVRRNYPVVGRFRNIFTELGEFFRQYFFAMDREELPFNRAVRNWITRSSSGASNTIAFGSTRNLTVPNTPIFVNAPYPPLDSDKVEVKPMQIGTSCRTPYFAPSFFNISGMSYGALSRPAVRALSLGAKKANIWMNTGEGGLSPFHLEGGCDIVFQIGTAKYGVRDEAGNLCDDRLKQLADIQQVRMFEIKLSQGAKPGKGGILPAEKVTKEIAEIRGIKIGEPSISPNRHTDIASNEELLDKIAHIRAVTGKPVGIKTVMGSFTALADLLDMVLARGMESAPDFITLDGGDGGTGAAPMPLMDLVGLPLRESLPRVVDMLAERGLQSRIRLIASGKLVVPGDVAWALATGADFVSSARGFMFSLGCIQALKCNKNTCPTGITTHNKRFQKGLVPENKADKVMKYAQSIVKEVGIVAHSVGVLEPRDMTRHHVRMTRGDGQSMAMDEIWPEVGVKVGAKSQNG